MAKSVHVIGLEPGELSAVTALVGLLRHADPAVGELCRQALAYLEDFAAERGRTSGELSRAAGRGA